MIWSLVDRSQSSRNAEQKKVLEAATANGLRLWFTNGMPLGPHYEAAGRGRMNFNSALAWGSQNPWSQAGESHRGYPGFIQLGDSFQRQS